MKLPETKLSISVCAKDWSSPAPRTSGRGPAQPCDMCAFCTATEQWLLRSMDGRLRIDDQRHGHIAGIISGSYKVSGNPRDLT